MLAGRAKPKPNNNHASRSSHAMPIIMSNRIQAIRIKMRQLKRKQMQRHIRKMTKPAAKMVVQNGGGADVAAVGVGVGAMVKTAKLVIIRLVIIRLVRIKLVTIRQHQRQMAKIKPLPAAPTPQLMVLQRMTTLRQRPKPAAVAAVDAVLLRLIQPQRIMSQKIMPQKIVQLTIIKHQKQRPNRPAMVR